MYSMRGKRKTERTRVGFHGECCKWLYSFLNISRKENFKIIIIGYSVNTLLFCILKCPKYEKQARVTIIVTTKTIMHSNKYVI